MKKGFSVADKSVTSGLVLPCRLRSGRRAATSCRNEEWAMSMIEIPTKKRTSWVDLRAAARRGRRNSAAERAGTVARTTAARSEGSSRLSKTRRVMVSKRAISHTKGKGVEVKDAATTRTKILEKTSKGKGVSKADKSVASGLVLPCRLRSEVRAATTFRSEEWRKSTFVIPIRKRTSWADLMAASRRARRNGAAARAATGAQTTGLGARMTAAAGSEDSSRLGKTRRVMVSERVTSYAKGKGMEVRHAATTKTKILEKPSKGKGVNNVDKSVASGLVLPSRLRSGVRAAITSRSEELGKPSILVPIRKRTSWVHLRAASRRAQRNGVAATAATGTQTTAVGARMTAAARSEGGSRLGKARRVMVSERMTSYAKGKRVEVRHAATTRTKILEKPSKGKGVSDADKSVASGSRSEEWGISSILVPIKKRTPRFELSAADIRKRADSRAAAKAVAARREGNSAGRAGAGRFGETSGMTVMERVTSDARGKRVRVESSAKDQGNKIVDKAAVRTRKAAAARVMTDVDSGEGTSMVDETRTRTVRERVAIGAMGEGASNVAEDLACRISSNILEDFQVEDID